MTMRPSSLNSRPLAPAVFCGVQEGYRSLPSFELWNLTAPVGPHPEGTTVSRQTLEKHGYAVPAASLQTA